MYPMHNYRINDSDSDPLNYLCAIYGAVCFHLTHSPVTIVRICEPYPIVIIKSEVKLIDHCLGLGHETMVHVMKQSTLALMMRLAFGHHYDDVIIVYSTIYSGAAQSKHQSSASLAFVWGIHRGPVNSPHKWPVTRKMFPFDDVIMHCVERECLTLYDITLSNLASKVTTAVSYLKSTKSCYSFLNRNTHHNANQE